jgi:hypothetical protein
MSVLARFEHEWRRFRDDTPGERFANHRDHVRDRPRKATIARTAIGVILVLIGFVLLFIPGPGLLFLLFGLALVATQSTWLAVRLDRAELWLRRKRAGTSAVRASSSRDAGPGDPGTPGSAGGAGVRGGPQAREH